ncbi:MAG: hypothetical protein ACXW2G_08365 [Burkholderiaceae bacterium]
MGSALLDRFIAHPDIRERFETTIRAPAPVVMQVATNFDMQSIAAVRWIFRLRERLLGAQTGARPPQSILDETQNLGWGVLDEQAGRFVVCGARCQPWLGDVKFSAMPPDSFAAYAGPDQVKIAWTLEAQELAPEVTRFVQETRAVATDAASRRKFMRYWRWARFGIIAIRLFMLPAVRREAERQWSSQSMRGAA